MLEVLLYAIARHMIVGHEDAFRTSSVWGAIALIFVIRKSFLCRPSPMMLAGGTAPDMEQQEKQQAEHTGKA